MERINGIQQLVNQWTEKMSEDGDSDFANDSISPCPSSPNEMHLEIDKHLEGDDVGSETEVDNADKNANELQSAEVSFVRDSGVGSSLRHRNRQQRLHWSGEHNLHSQTSCLQIDRQSAAQLNLLQKMALLKLTALMDKHSPCSRQGWNWTVPKFIRKIKALDYKDRTVFGVPLLLNARRTGNPLPPSILKAMHYLRNQCLDQVGLFRKSGVKSRIQHLREMNETDPQSVSYEGQSAFDVADMVKQYFRDLPEPVFTSKLCESFLHIYQYFPKDQQLSAVQAAVLLLPDENREALQTLLCLLRDVVACVAENQMTPTNIAVCLAPSLFHLNTLKRESPITSRSNQRKHSLGMPDQRDLSENLAASQGLAHMVAESSQLFQPSLLILLDTSSHPDNNEKQRVQPSLLILLDTSSHPDNNEKQRVQPSLLILLDTSSHPDNNEKQRVQPSLLILLDTSSHPDNNEKQRVQPSLLILLDTSSHPDNNEKQRVQPSLLILLDTSSHPDNNEKQRVQPSLLRSSRFHLFSFFFI
ncbi:UNVERIFIED_CONTAM: hypothetical protein FKN15_076964 [Acipenser sinensis]